MASKRKLKKAVTAVCGELLADCVAIALAPESPREEVDKVMTDIFQLQDDMMCGISTPEPGMKPKAYYAALCGNFKTRIESILERLQALI